MIEGSSPPQFIIPKVPTDPEADDYLSELERGLATSRELLQGQEHSLTDLRKKSFQSVAERMESIDGIVAYTSTMDGMSELIGQLITSERIELTPDPAPEEANLLIGELPKYGFHLVQRGDLSKDQLRQIADTAEEIRFNQQVNAYPIQRRITTAIRGVRDFTDAIGSLTEIVALIEPSLDNTAMQLYFIRPDGVYEMITYRDNSQIELPKKNPKLQPEWFADETLVADLKISFDGEPVNTYVVTNPSNALEIRGLAHYGFKKLGAEYRKLQEQRDAQRAETWSPIQWLRESAANAIAYFKSEK